MLVLKDVSRTAGGGLSFHGISLAIAAGRPTAIVGLSTAERIAFGRLVSGVDRPQAGDIRLGGEDIAKARASRGRVLRLCAPGLPASGRRVGKFGREVVALAGLTGQVDAKLARLSAAQRMKLALAQAALARPQLLIVDAPTAQLTPEAGDDLRLALPGLLAPATGVVLLLAASAAEALALSGDTAVFAGGRLIQSGGVGEVAAHPVNLSSAIATSWPQLNTLALMARDGRWQLGDGSRLQLPESLALPAEGGCTLAFHPKDVTLERASPGCLRFVVRAAGPVRDGYLPATFAGATWMCPLAVEAPHEGALLNAFVDRSRLMLFDAEGKALT
jgi:ABC-type sulfate/molybdate transport systems ATPase subunit